MSKNVKNNNLQPDFSKFANFRGNLMKLDGSFACKAFPEGFSPNEPSIAEKEPSISKNEPSMWRLDRWGPIGEKSKLATRDFPEAKYDKWFPTMREDIIVATQQGGNVIPNNYFEWFWIVVIRPKSLSAQDALFYAQFPDKT